MSTPAPTGRAGDAPTLPDDHPLHEVMALVNKARRAALGSVPLPPTTIDLAGALFLLAHAVTVLASRTLDPPAEAARAGEEATTDARATDR